MAQALNVIVIDAGHKLVTASTIYPCDEDWRCEGCNYPLSSAYPCPRCKETKRTIRGPWPIPQVERNPHDA